MSLSRFIKIVVIGFVLLFFYSAWAQSVEKISEAGELIFKTNIGYGASHSSPAIGSDGTVYVGSADSCLYALFPNGEVKWKFQTEGIINSSPSIDDNGMIYVGSNDSCLYSINYDGILNWKLKTEDIVFSSPAIAEDGTIYVGSNDRGLYAVHPDGTLKWKYMTEDGSVLFKYGIYGDAYNEPPEYQTFKGGLSSSSAVSVNGLIFIGSRNEYLHAFDNNGSLLWKTKVDFDHEYHTNMAGSMYLCRHSWGFIYSSPAIGKDGTLYVGTDNNDLYAFYPNGTVKWKSNLSTASLTVNGYSSPAIGNDETIYIGSFDNKLYAYNPDGTMKWSYPTQGRIDSSPEIGSDGTIYVGSGDTNLYAIYSDGTLKFKYKTEGSVLSSPVISEEGIIYFRSNDGYLYAIDSGTNAGLANTPWPMFGHNQLHTHRSQIESYAVTGNVLMGDKGLPNVNVTLERIGFSQVQQTDHEGFYSLNNVLNGTYTITFHKDGVPLNPSSIEITVNDLDIIVQTIAATNYITILTPNGNEILEANTQYIISWKLHNVEEISIDYSEDGGLSWTQVASNISTPVRSYPWTIPNISSNQCIVKLTDVSNSSVFDMSDSTFTIERDQEYGIQISDTGVSKSSLSLSPNGNWITYIEDGDVWVMSLNGGEPINFSEDIEHGCYKPSFTLDSDNILFSFGYIKVEFGIGDVYYSTIHEKNIKTLELIKSTTSGYITGQWKGWSKNGRFVYSVSSRQSAWGNYQLSIIDNIGQSNYSEEYSEMGDPSGRPGISSIIFSPDDTHFVISNNNLIRRINFETGLCDTLEIDGPCSDYSPDGKWIMYNTDKLHVYNTETGINYPVFQDEEYLANSGCFSPDGSKICYLHPINGFTEVFIADFPYYSPVFVNENETPTEFSLSQNYPNPFNEVTIIKYSLPQKSHVTFIIYNLTGQAISVLKNENQKAGNYSITWNAAEMPSGLYFFTLSADNFTETRKMILVK